MRASKHFLTSFSVQVMLSSISASAKGIADHSVYSGSKGAVEAFARCLAVGESSILNFVPSAYMYRSFLRSSTDFGRKGVTVNAIAPGGIKTDMYVEAARKYIPNEASMTDQQIDEVMFSFPSVCSLPNASKLSLLMMRLHLACGHLVPSGSCWGARGRLPCGGFPVQSGWRVDEWAGARDWRWGCHVKEVRYELN